MAGMTAVHPLHLWLCLVVLSTSCVAEQQLSNCRKALGMQSGAIPDSAISASSSFDEKSVGPLNSRIRTERNGGAWCPGQFISPSVYEWLQVDLDEVKVITLVETQGRFGNGQGQEYSTNYMLEYQRLDTGRWIRYQNYKGDQIIKGNINTHIAEMRELRPPIIAKRIRFIPYATHTRTVCMRVELYGCPWTDGTLSYSMQQGDRRGTELDLHDFYYDGEVNNGYLSNGLGQLTDLEEGNTNFRLDILDIGRKGYEWVGWKNDSLNSRPVEIVFTFDAVRSFTYMKLHCNNLFSKDVRVFQRAELYFSTGGKFYQPEPLHFEHLRDDVMELARTVIIPIPHRVGRKVKAVLYFDSRWMMISEIRFSSEVVTGVVTEESSPIPTLPDPTTPLPASSPHPKSPKEQDPGLRIRGPAHVVEVDIVPGNNSPSGDKNNSPKAVTDVPYVNSEAHLKKKNMDDTYIGIIIGTLAALILLLVAIVTIVAIRNRRNKYNSKPIKTMFGTDHINFNLNDLSPSNGKVSNGNKYNAIATTEDDRDGSLQKLTNGSSDSGVVIDLPREPSDTDLSQTYANPAELGKYSPLVVSLPPAPIYCPTASSCQASPKPTCRSVAPPLAPPARNSREKSPTPPPPPPHPTPRAICAATAGDVVSIQGLTGNSVYAVPNNHDLLWKEEMAVMEFPREKMKFVEKLGEGQFGEVHLCEAIGMAEVLSNDYPTNRSLGSRSLLVAVKMLRHNANENTRSDFHKEVRIMSQLRDPNIVRVLGVCTQEEPLAVVVEYMKYGDLNQFLLQHVPEGSPQAARPNQHTLSYGFLIYMATQIASGMKYLETLNMVHRDLATRNCLVGTHGTIKISDFGMSRSLYSNDYYRIEGKAVLPIRWMAWESVLLGKFSCKSDVWSMAVTLWEILTFAREQPFDALSDEQVIENLGHFYRNDSQELYLPQPSNCPKEIYDLMFECWNRDETQRPSFREIHMFLSRKNLGYDPREEVGGCGTSAGIVPVV